MLFLLPFVFRLGHDYYTYQGDSANSNTNLCPYMLRDLVVLILYFGLCVNLFTILIQSFFIFVHVWICLYNCCRYLLVCLISVCRMVGPMINRLGNIVNIIKQSVPTRKYIPFFLFFYMFEFIWNTGF